MTNRIIPAILAVMALLVVGLGVLIYLQFRPMPSADFIAGVGEQTEGAAVDSGARIEIVQLQGQIETLRKQLDELSDRMTKIEARPIVAARPAAPNDNHAGALVPDLTDRETGVSLDYAQVVLIGERRQLNTGLRIASPSYLESVLGRPRAVLSDDCEAMTNDGLKSKLVLDTVGPIRVRMLQPAVDSLKRVFAKVEATDPDLYSRINTAGSLCVRQIRGTNQRTSTHSFGLSVDLNIDGQLDRLGDGRTQLGLTILADFFRDEGWYWGAGFTREDSMHFEVSRDQVERWIAEGAL